MAGPNPTHSGTVVFRDTKEGRDFLLITAKDHPEVWVLPKGHIEPGEPAEKAALRELIEETGVVAEILCVLGTISFEVTDEHVVAKFFLARFVDMKEPLEERALEWLTYEQARQRLTFENTRTLLDTAAQALSRPNCDRLVVP